MKSITKVVFGSNLYGTNTKSSDIDYKGVFLPPIRDCILNKIPKSISYSSGDDKSKNTKDDIDEEIYSLQYFIKLACEGQTVAIDMIHANDECVVETSDIWKEIVKNRSKFYTNNLSAFIGYARKQAAKYGVKGSRLNTCQEVLFFLKQQNKESKLIHLWDILPTYEHINFMRIDEMLMYQVCGKKFQSSVKVGYVIPIIEKFVEEYGSRAKLAAENKGVDWKAVSHAIRAAYQVKEIFETNDLIFPLKNADVLLKVKQGQMDYVTEVSPLLEELMDEVEELSKKSKLPNKVNRKFWDNFIVSAYG